MAALHLRQDAGRHEGRRSRQRCACLLQEALLSEAFRFQCTMVLTRPEWAHAMHMHTSLTGANSRQPGAAEALRMLNLRPRQARQHQSATWEPLLRFEL